MHDTGSVRAVSQAIGVTQLVYSFFDSPLMEEGFVVRQTVERLPQAGQGDESLPPTHGGLAKYKVESRGVEVEVHQPQQPLGRQRHLPQLIQDSI